MNATIHETHDEFDAADPGAILLWRYASKKKEGGNNGHIMLKCPGCGQASGMHVRDPGTPHPTNGASWEIIINNGLVTLSPSINCVGCCGWHGYLRDNVYSTC